MGFRFSVTQLALIHNQADLIQKRRRTAFFMCIQRVLMAFSVCWCELIWKNLCKIGRRLAMNSFSYIFMCHLLNRAFHVQHKQYSFDLKMMSSIAQHVWISDVPFSLMRIWVAVWWLKVHRYVKAMNKLGLWIG